jgi:photosystem II stability/assembly factor-like uncharacterized protein
MKIPFLAASVLLGAVALLQVAPAHAALDQWSTGGPAGVGPINTVEIDPNNPLVVYAGSGAGGAVSKSTDGGATWNPASTGLPGNAKTSLVVDPNDSSIVYVGTFGAGVYKSVNGGGDWFDSSDDNGMVVESVLSVALDPQNSTIVYASTTAGSVNGVFRSTNGGEEWTAVGTGLPVGIVSALAIDPQTTSTIYAGTQSGVYKTTNSGGSWEPMNNGFAPDSTPSINKVVINPHNPSHLYVGTGGFGVWQSTDGGASWAPATSGITSSLINDLVMDPQRPDVLYAATSSGGVFRTTDGGGSWTAFNDGLTEDTIEAIAISPSGTCLHAGTNVNGASGQVFDFELVAGCGPMGPPQIALGMTIEPPTVTVDDVVHVNVSLANAGGAAAQDLYFALLVPPALSTQLGCPGGDAVVFLTDGFSGISLTCLLAAAPQSFVPLIRNAVIPGGLPTVDIPDFWTLVWPEGLPAGTYTLVVFTTPPDAFADGFQASDFTAAAADSFDALP